MKGEKKSKLSLSFKSRVFRAGSYSIAVTAIVVAIAIGINLLFGAIPSSATKLDMTSQQLFSISEQTENIVGSLNDDVTIYWVVQSGQEDTYIKELLDRYTSLGSKLNVIKKDPVVNPGFVSQYTDEDAENNSLIVVNGERSRYVAYSDIYVTDYSEYYYTYDESSITTEFYGENALTGAIDYVVNDDLPKVYTLSGHGESTLPTELASAVEGENIETEDLSLLTLESVPEDADCVMIYAPQSDISTDEKDKILSYLKSGGKLLLVTDYLENTLTNLSELISEYGAILNDGIVIEGDTNHSLQGYQHYLLPDYSGHEITDPLSNQGYHVLVPLAQGISVSDDLRDTLTVRALLETSDSAYSKVAGYNLTTYDKESGDIDGPFDLAVAITDTINDENETEIVWFTSAQMFTSEVNQLVSGANYDVFLNSLGWMCDQEESIAIHAKSLSTEKLTVSSGSASLMSILLIGVVPLILIGIGITVMIRRRRR